MNIDNTSKVINGYCYYLKDKIGKGSSSQVFRGIHQKSAEQVAIKVVSLTQCRKESLLSVATSEIQLLTKLKDLQNIIQIRTAIRTKNNIYIVTQLCPGGTLEHFIEKNKHCDQDVAVNIIQQIIKAYEAISSKGFIHRDIKPSNIFKNGNTFKVGDFGYAIEQKVCADGPLDQNVGSPRYMPLQSLQGNLYSFKSDIWAIGLIFLELILGKTPWKSKTQKQLMVQLKHFQPKNIIPKYISPNSRLFIQKALELQVEKRMSLQELLNWNFPLATLKKDKRLGSTIKINNFLQPPAERRQVKSNRQSFCGTQISIPIVSPTSTPKKQSEILTRNSFTSNECINASPEKYASSSLQIKHQNSNKTINIAYKTKIESLFSSDNIESPHHNIISQLQAQISYFRYLLKTLKRLNLFKTTNTKIMDFKCGLLSMIYVKMAEIKDFKFVKGASNAQKSAFLKSTIYSTLQSIISKYKQRCKDESDKHGLKVALLSQRQFIKQLSYLMDFVYVNMHQLKKTSNEEFSKKKHLVLILQDLITLSSLYLLQRQEHWLHFKQKSNINAILIQSTPKQINLQYLEAVEAKFLELGRS